VPNDKITIAIPTLQKRIDVLEKLVKTLNEDEAVGEIIIIDNASKGIPFSCEKLRVIDKGENIFVNPAWNLGVEEAKFDIVGLLNDDIIIPFGICSKIIQEFKKNKTIGALAFHLDDIKPIDDIMNEPKLSDYILERADFVAGGYGMALFFKKELYNPIPKSLKIWFGDNYIFNQIKKSNCDNYWIEGQTIYHLGSLSSGAFKKSSLYKADKKAWNKIKYKWYHYIFSIEEYSDCKKLRLFGLNIRIKCK